MNINKLHEHRSQTGSGPPSEIKLSEIEKGALGVWGEVAVVGAATSYDGLLGPSTDSTDVTTTTTASCSYKASAIAIACDSASIFIDNADSNTLEPTIILDTLSYSQVADNNVS